MKESLNPYLKLLKEPITLANYVMEHLGQYEKTYPPMQPDILLGEKPKVIAALLRKGKGHRSADEDQLINAWRHWRDEVWKAEGENETKLRLLFRALIIFNREVSNKKDEHIKDKYSGCIDLIDNFLKEVWKIPDAMEAVIAVSWWTIITRHRQVSGMTNEWRDPLGYAK